MLSIPFQVLVKVLCCRSNEAKLIEEKLRVGEIKWGKNYQHLLVRPCPAFVVMERFVVPVVAALRQWILLVGNVTRMMTI